MLHDWRISGSRLSFRRIFRKWRSNRNIIIQWVRLIQSLDFNRNSITETKDITGTYTKKEYCPLDGKFSVKYKNNNPRKPNECTGYDSSMDSCPSGSILNFRLRGCSTDNHGTTFGSQSFKSTNPFTFRSQIRMSWELERSYEFTFFGLHR